MTAADYPEFVSIMAKLAEVFDKTVSDMLLDEYFRTLAPFPIDALDAGAKTVIRFHKYFPRPSEWAEEAEAYARVQQEIARDRLAKERGLTAKSEVPDPDMHGMIRAMLDSLKRKLGWSDQPPPGGRT